MYYISVSLILTELFHLEYLNLQSIILRSSDWISINRPPFDSSYREESNGIYYISIALILTELFRFEFYNKNLTLFTPISTLFRPYFDPISTLGGPGPDHFDPGGLISVSCIIPIFKMILVVLGKRSLFKYNATNVSFRT